MYNRTTYTIRLIKNQYRWRRLITALCVILVICGLLFFVIYAFNNKRQNIKYISYRDRARLNSEKIMTNPRIKFEYEEGQFYNIRAKQAVHIDESDILLSDVEMKGDIGSIKAGKLMISNDGDTLDFSGNPVLIIKKTDLKK